MLITNPTRIVTGEVRLSYAHVWEPKSIQGGKPEHSTSLIIPKSDTTTTTAIEAGISKFGGKRLNKAALKLPLPDGDIKRDVETYANTYFLNTNSPTAPQIVDGNDAPILDRAEVYSVCYTRVSLKFYEFNTSGNRDFADGLGNIQKLRDSQSLGSGRVSTETDFDTYVPADDFLN